MKTSLLSLTRLCRFAGGTAALAAALLCSPSSARADSNGSQEWHSDRHSDSDYHSDSDRHSDRESPGAPVPEPSTWLMMGTLIAGAAYVASRSRTRVTASSL
jgi:hypothetical protein